MTPAQMADKAEMLYRLGLGYGARGRAKQVAFEQIHAMMPEVIQALHRLQRLDDDLALPCAANAALVQRGREAPPTAQG